MDSAVERTLIRALYPSVALVLMLVGRTVYLVDVRGFGKSTRPEEMEQPAEDNAPIARTDTAVKDVGAAIDFIFRAGCLPHCQLFQALQQFSGERLTPGQQAGVTR